MLVAVFILVYLRREEAQKENIQSNGKPETAHFTVGHTHAHLNQASAAYSEFSPVCSLHNKMRPCDVLLL